MDPNAYGTYAVPLAIISVLTQVIFVMVKKRRENGHADDFRAELRTDIKELKRTVHAIQDLLNSIVTKLALAEYRITRLEDREVRKP